jgi:undecaprenyl-diphosphatase
VIVDSLVRAVILGIVEGATEFLPVSSTGHLILASNWLGALEERDKTFDIFIQLGAILAIVWLYRGRFAQILRELGRNGPSRRLVINLAIAFLPAAVVGLLAHDFIKSRLFTPGVVAGALIVGGILMLVIERFAPPPRIDDVDAIPTRTALGVGLAQVLSLVPGTSRAAATIMGGYALGLSRRAATEFSFFLAVPVLVAATGFDLVKGRHALHGSDVPMFAVGFIVSFITALVVVRAFLRYVSHRPFAVFAWYRIALGIVVLLVLRGARLG